MSNSNEDMEKYQPYNFETSGYQKDLKNLLKDRIHLISFFKYLKDNKIQYNIIGISSFSNILLKIATLNPKYFMIIFNEVDVRNNLVDYEELNNFREEILLTGENDYNFYIIFLDPNIKSPNELRAKSKYVRFQKISLKQEFERIKKTNVKILIKKELRKGLPIGKYSKHNKLNELTGKEWIKFSKSWFVHNPPPRGKDVIVHPAKFPETLIEKFLRFFTKERHLILDPFLGTGTTAIAARNTLRSCIGIEINKKYVKIAESKIAQETIKRWIEVDKNPIFYKIFHDDSNNIEKIWQRENLALADFCITSPPYWNQLKRNHIRQQNRKKKGIDTYYSEDSRDIGNIDDYKEFISAQKKIFSKVYKILNNKSYLVLITNNLFFRGRLQPLAFDTALSLSKKWVLKDELIWCQDDKNLIPLGVNNAYVGNRHHVYCLIFRKEEN